MSASIFKWPSSLCVFMYLSLSVSYKDIRYWIHLNSEWLHLEILTLITSAKTFIPNKIPFWGLGWAHLLGASVQPTVGKLRCNGVRHLLIGLKGQETPYHCPFLDLAVARWLHKRGLGSEMHVSCVQGMDRLATGCLKPHLALGWASAGRLSFLGALALGIPQLRARILLGEQGARLDCQLHVLTGQLKGDVTPGLIGNYSSSSCLFLATPGMGQVGRWVSHAFCVITSFGTEHQAFLRFRVLGPPR